jgi:chromosome segregation ATPase
LKKERTRANAEKDRYTESEQVGTELEKVLTAYEQALPNLIKGYQDAHTYADTKMRMILCAVEKKKPEIDQKIAQYDRQITEKTAAVEQLKAKKKAAEDLVKQAQTDKDKKEEQYKYWHDLQSNDEKKLQEIKDLKTKIEQEDEASHAASMYFLALELQKVLQSIKIVNKEDFKYHLLTALTERDKANEVLRQRQSELSQVTSALNAEQSELDQLKEKRRENVLKIVATCDERPDQNKKSEAAK